MSLINDALRKARLESARKGANRAKTQLPNLHRSAAERSEGPISASTVVLLAFGAIAVGIVATLVISRSPTSDQTPAPVPTEPAAVRAEPGATAVPDGSGTAGRASEPATTAPSAEGAKSARTEIEPRPTEASIEPSYARSEPEPVRSAAPGREGTASQGASRRAALSTSPPNSLDEPMSLAQATAAPADRASTTPNGNSRQLADKPVTASGPEQSATVTAVEEGATEIADPDPRSDEVESFLREASIAGVGTFRLDGIAWSSDQPFALVNGEVVSAGGFVDGAAVTEVARDRVVLSSDGFVFELRLR